MKHLLVTLLALQCFVCAKEPEILFDEGLSALLELDFEYIVDHACPEDLEAYKALVLKAAVLAEEKNIPQVFTLIGWANSSTEIRETTPKEVYRNALKTAFGIVGDVSLEKMNSIREEQAGASWQVLGVTAEIQKKKFIVYEFTTSDGIKLIEVQGFRRQQGEWTIMLDHEKFEMLSTTVAQLEE